MICTVIVARYYGARVLGIIAFLNSFLLFTTIFALMGTNTSILRLIPEHMVKFSPTSALKIYRKIQFMVIGISLVMGALFFFCSHLIADRVFAKPYLSFYFSLAAIFIVFKALMLLNTQAVRGLRLIKTFAFMQVLPQGANLILLLLLGLIFADEDIPVYAFMGSVTVTGIFGWMVMEYCFKRSICPDERVEPTTMRKIFSVSLPMLMTTSMHFFIDQTGVVLLGIFRTASEVGYYDVAVKLATSTTFVLVAINTIAAPKFSELYHSNRLDELFYIATKSAKIIFWTTTPIFLCFILIGKPILHLIFGKNFLAAYPPMVLLVLGQFVNSISGSTGFFMNMTGNQKVFGNIVFIAAMINLGLNMLLTPWYGVYGASFAAMISIAVWNIAVLYYSKKKYGKTTGYFPIFSDSRQIK